MRQNGHMMSASVISFVLDKIQHLAPGLVYVLVVALVFGEAALFVGFVLPGETAVLVAGFVASQGRVNIVLLCALVVLAAIIGDSVGYAIGSRFGHRLFTLPLVRSKRDSLEKALEILQKRGPTYVFLGRFTAFLRAVMPGLAGMSKMHYRSFLLANALGGLVWGLGFTLLGYFGGNALHTIEKSASWVGIVVLILLVAAFTTTHILKKRRESAQGF